MPRLVHDRLTLLLYAQLGVWGFFLYGFGPVVPLLRDEQGVSAALASLHGTGLAVGVLIAGFVFSPLSRRIGRGATIWTGLVGVALVIGVLWVARPLPLTVGAAVLASIFGSFIVNGVNAALSDHQGAAAPAALSEANAAAAFTGVVSPLVVGAFVAAGLGWRPALSLVVLLILGVLLLTSLWRVPVPVRSAQAFAVVASDRRLPRPYWITLVLLAATSSIEVCFSLWAVDVLRTHAGMSSGPAAAGFAAVLAGMFVGRLAAGRVALHVPTIRLLLLSLGVTLAGFALFWVGTVPWLAVGGLFVVGLGIAVQYPLVISLALAAAPGQADRAAGLTSYPVALGFGVAPVLLGALADRSGTHEAFLVLPAFIAAAVGLTVWLARSLALPKIGEPHTEIVEQVA
ncbi:Predicted arabinose efflux permease, MFS family [Asanoa hainanensis]|uniref:Predicted arabinose efflux permease, MFS family n=1 Tax=Asanoa hainanensis TaxID=560556 RepID=A0A239KL82_9ACTN|nr:MFS transporter [Asanoa hainanensis]SNT18472.1 Predicted arabinose efflux permease, MFS family [Asanoa hainanensis]